MKRSGVFDSTVKVDHFDFIHQKMDESIEDELEQFDEDSFMKAYNNIMTQLQAIPFDDSKLPEITAAIV
jgi:hypothetical protein